MGAIGISFGLGVIIIMDIVLDAPKYESKKKHSKAKPMCKKCRKELEALLEILFQRHSLRRSEQLNITAILNELERGDLDIHDLR